ncbi:hypothetical protein BDR04DRAFT_1215192, partial [Suillus decipiens]
MPHNVILHVLIWCSLLLSTCITSSVSHLSTLMYATPFEQAWRNDGQKLTKKSLFLLSSSTPISVSHVSLLPALTVNFQGCGHLSQHIYNVEPDSDFRRALQDYVRSTSEWSNGSMGLEEHNEQAKRDVHGMFVYDIWHTDNNPAKKRRPRTPPNGVSDPIHLAMHILSVVPNSTATERIFSQFGIIHTKLRNRLSPDKVRKQALVKFDT